MDNERILSTLDEIKVISDSFRLKILLLFGDDSTPLTVKQMAVKLEEIPSKVHYHVKELERIKVLEIVETKEKSGIVEKFYMPTAKMFKVQRDINIQEEENELLIARKNILDSMCQDFLTADNSKKQGDKIVLNYSSTYLTNEDISQLEKLIIDFIDSRPKAPDSKPYMLGYTLFRKYN